MATGGEAEGSHHFLSFFTAGASSKMAHLCDRLCQRQEMFQQLHVRTACLALLSGNYLSITTNQKGAQEVLSFAPTCKTLLQFMLTMLPECGDNYLPVFRCVHGFCVGEGFLGLSDEPLLVEQMKLCEAMEGGEALEEKKEEEGDLAKGGRKSSEKDEVDVEAQSKRTTSDPKAEIQKLFSHLKTSRHDSKKAAKPRPWKETKGPRNPFAGTPSHPMREVVIDVLKQLDAWKVLHGFCVGLPIFKMLEEDKAFLSSSVAEGGSTPLDTLIERLHQIKNAVVAVSVLVHLICPPYLLHPPTSSVLNSLSSLLTHCLSAATAAARVVAWLKSDYKTPGGATGGGGKHESACVSVVELLSLISYCQTPSPASVTTARTLAHDITTLTLKVFSKLLEVAKKLPGHKANIVQNLHTVMVYQSLCGLMPLLATLGGSGVGQGRGPSHVKLTVPLVELTGQAMRSTLAILEVLSTETAEEPLSADTALPSVAALVVTEHYSSWQCAQMLFSHLPLLKILFNILTHSCKKTLVLMSSQAAAVAPGASAEKTSKSPPIKTRTEKQERLVHLLRESLSRKISEKLAREKAAKEKEKNEEGEDEGGGSVSPTSTLSSGGDREGVYTLYADSLDSGDESIEEYVEAPPTPPFMLAFSGELPPIPPAPTSPPMPPKRRISVPLEPPPLMHKTFPDPPTHHPKGKGVPTPEVQVPRYAEQRKKPEFYLGLASATLKCLSVGIVQSDHTGVQKLFQDKLRPEFISQLAWLILNIGSTSSLATAAPLPRKKREAKKAKTAASILKQELSSVSTDLMEMVHEMILNDSSHHMLHDVLLHELGLSAKCWSLAIPLASLSVLGRVLVCRLQRQSQGLDGAETSGSDDQLTVSIWKGFLTAVAENASSSDEQDEDLGAPHMQLMLFVWHSFSAEMRRVLLTQCAQSVVSVAKDNESGVKLHPLAVSRLLLLFDYMLFQFSTPAPKLTEQVNHNLFSVGGSASPTDVSVYVCEQQLQFSTVLSKPPQATSGSNDSGARANSATSGTGPKFYNVRPSSLTREEGGEDVVDTGIDEEACKIVLHLPESSEGVKGYNELCRAVVVLMSCGIDYARQTEDLQGRVLAANAIHQCFSLSVSLLRHLPPSYDALTSIVDGNGLSCKNSVGACQMVYSMYLCMRIKMQQIEPDDVMDTLVESNYSREEAEEILARVLSVVDSADHFISQTTTILEDFLSAEEDTVLPLFCVVALDFLICLLTRVVVDETEPDEEEEEGTEVKSKLPSPPPPPPLPPVTPSNKTTPPPPIETEDHAYSAKEDAFYRSHGKGLIQILMKTASKLLAYCRLYAMMVGNQPVFLPLFTEPPASVLDGIMKLAGRDPLQTKDTKPLFHAHIPDEVQDRIKTWNMALLIDPAHKEKLCSHDLDSPVSDLMVQFLNLHFCAFTGTRTFDPTRCLKSSLSSLMSLLSTLFEMIPQGIFDPPENSTGSPAETPEYLTHLVPLSCDMMMEFCGSDMLKLVKICGEKSFSLKVSEHRVRESFKLMQLPKICDCRLLGPLLADFFAMLSSMMDDPASQPVLSLLQPDNPECDIVSLILFAGLPDVTGSAVIESLKFLSKLLSLAHRREGTHHLAGLIAQVNMLGHAELGKLLEGWLRRLVLGSSSDGPSYVALNVSYLFKFVELLTIEESMLSSTVESALFATLLPLGDQLITEMKTQPKLLPVFVDFFQSLMLLAGTGNIRGHLSLVQVVEKWFPDCVSMLSEENDAALLLGPQLSGPVATMLQYLSHLYSAVLFLTNMLKCNEKRNAANEEDSPLVDSESEDEEDGESPSKDDDYSQGEDSEGEALNSKLCTYTVTHKEFRHQHWYHCHTCGLVDGTGACSVCAKVCHKGHDLTYSKCGSFFCDCGAKEGGNCKALVKRGGDAKANTPVSPHEASTLFSSERRRKKSRKRRSRKEEKWPKVETDGEKGKEKKKSERKSSFPTLPTLRVINQIEDYKNELRQYLDASPLCAHVRAVVSRLLPHVVSTVDFSSTFGCNSARQAMIDLHNRDKAVEYTDNLMAATLGSQEGAFENVRLSFQGDQGQQLRQLLSSNAVRRVAMCALSSVKGHRQHLAVNHDKGKITFLQLFPILRQTQSNRRKLTLTRLSTATVPFTVISVAHNPCHEDFMVVCGLKECQLLVLNSSAQVTSRAVLHPSVEPDGYIVKAVWVPGSQTELVVITDTFVKIYDLRVDLISPVYYFVILTGKIRDATIAVTGEGKFVVVMSSTGTLYSQPVIPACNAMEGPVYFTIDLPVNYPSTDAVEEEGEENMIFGGGVSVYYSHTLKMLFFSFMNGKSFMGSPNNSLTDVRLVVHIPLKIYGNSGASKGPGPALMQWTEVQHHPGLVCALCQNTNNPVVMLVKPDQIQVHELKALPNKAKVQGMVAMRQPPSSDATTHHRTTLIILCEDGSLRIYVANNNVNTEYWMQSQFKPTSPLVILRGKGKRKMVGGAGHSDKLKFPVDFFEHCQALQVNDIEFGGGDVLHVYNKQQLKHRLNANSLYVVSTKSGGFSIEVTNNLSSTVALVGVRVMVGHKSIEKAPSFVEVFGRTHQVSFPANSHRWIDIPFTREESLLADKTIRINFGPSLDPSGVNIVDAIVVYGQAKTTFGWPEHASEAPVPTKAASTSSSQGEEEETAESLPVTSSKPLSHLGRMICDAFSVLGNHNVSVEKHEQPDLGEVVSEATSFLMHSVPHPLQYHMRFLLASMAHSRDHFHQFKDKMQLSHVIQALSPHRPGSSISSDMEPEYFQYLLLMLLSIARHRPHNLTVVAAELSNLLLREEEEGESQDDEGGGGEGGGEGGGGGGGGGGGAGGGGGGGGGAGGGGGGGGGDPGAGVNGGAAGDAGGDNQGGGESGGDGGGEGGGGGGGAGGGGGDGGDDKRSEGDGSDGDRKETKVMVKFLDILNDGFWEIYVLRCFNPAVSPVINPGFTALDATVLAMTEIMWKFVHVNHDLVDHVLKYTIRFLLAPNSQMCEAALSVVTRLLKPRKPKKEKENELGEEVMSPEPVSTDDGQRPTEEDKEGSATPSHPQPAVEVVEGEEEEEGEGGGGGEGGGRGGREGVGGGGGEGWVDLMQEPIQPPQQVELENLLPNPAAALQQLAANPEQYLIAMQGAPDEETMMNLAIALSLQEEAGGSPEAGQALQAALQGLGLPVAMLGGMGGHAGGEGAGQVETEEGRENEDEEQMVPDDEDDGGGEEEGEEDTEEQGEEDFEVPQVVSFDVGSAALQPRVGTAEEDEEGGGVEGDRGGRSRSNSEGSSVYAENMMREATATPSEVRIPPSAQSSQRQARKNPRDTTMVTGSTPEVSQDPSSETEMVNYSSGEDEPGESDHTLVETLSQMESPPSTVPREEEEGAMGGEREALDSPAQLAMLRKRVLRSLLEQLYLVEMAGGMRSICFMKLILFVAEHLECNKEDCEALIHMLKTFLRQLHLDREDLSGMVERSRQNEVLLLYLRFFNILMSRKKVKQDDAKVETEYTTEPSYASNMLWFATARTLLNDSHLLQFCRSCLIAVMEKKQCLDVNEEPTPFVGAVLQPKFNPPLSDLSPFFQRHYVKGASDIFMAYGRLLAEIALVLPNQLRKMSEVTKHLPTPELGPQWTDTLCDFLLKVAQTTGVGRRHVRKLLLQLCGSKESYRLTRDVHALHSFMKNIREICHSRGGDPERAVGMPLNLSYKSTLSLIEHLKACDEVACTRTSNWQTFCLEEKTTLPYLFQTVFLLDEGLAPLILQLVQVALSGIPPKPAEKEQPKKESGGGKKSGKQESRKEGKEAKEGKEQSKETKESKPSTPTPSPDKEKCQALVRLFISFLNDETLLRFIKLFLLQSNASSLRWQAHSLLHTIYTHGTSQDQSRVVELLWQLWPDMPTYGWKASQFVDLLGYCTISTPHIMEKETLCQSYVERAIALLKSQNKVVATHPNSHIYSQLLSIVDFDGYYLENKPCLVCNDPEVPYSVMKLYQMKSEVRYSPNMILFKLVGSFTVSQVTLQITDVKRSKMVKTVNVYYSNRTMQNIIELKNKRSLWLKARSLTLSPGQTEVKIDLPLPIIACNVIIEFADFYENIQGGSEVLQCPRCQAAVSAHPGVCATCGENVYQCHKCRAINYDEKDPFLCNSCGFSKYAKFELTVEAKTCSAVDPIENEDDRKKTTAHISQLLEQADGMYKLLVQHRNELDSLLTSLASGMQIVPSGRSSSSSEGSGVHRGIQLVAQRYCADCKTTYHELSKVVQGVLASRRELVKYDQKKAELGSVPSEPSTPAVISTPLSTPHSLEESPSFPPATSQMHKSQCFGCISAATEHCITLLKAFALKPQTRRQLVLRKLIQELVDFNLRNGSPQMQQKIRELLCIVTREDETATAELNNYVSDRVLEHITPNRTTPTLASMVRPEILLLTTSLSMEDSCWEQRLKTVVKLFRKSQDHPSPAVTAAVTMPCLKIIQGLINPKDPTTTKNKDKPLVEVSSVGEVSDRLRVRARDWLRGKPGTSFQSWKDRAQQKDVCDMERAELHSYRLAEKYAAIWKNKTQKLSQFHSTLKQVSWLRSMLFNMSSQSARQATANILASLAHGEARQRQILDMLCSFLDEVTDAGEHSQEFLELLKILTEDESCKWKSYLAMRGVLPKIGTLIGKEIDRLLELEETSLSSDLSQGYALKMLTSLLQSFLRVDRIKQHFKGKLVGMVLDGYLSLRRLVIQRTKRVDETQELLLSMLEDLTSGAEEEKEEFMALCVQALNKLKKSDLVTPVFVFERLCNIIRPEVKDVHEFYLSLEKDPQQEEFLQGRMQGNPYPSSTAGLGPLMRDVKNKICTDCELVALLEDDTGMELLVCNKIVSLDLPVKEVFKKIWCSQPNHGVCMRVVYRMRGLLGDATEDMVEKLDDGKDKNVDEEQEFKMAAILSRCEGLDSVMWRLACVRDFIQGHQLISAALKLLDCCTKLKVNRQYLLQPHLHAVNTLLGVFNLAVDYEDQHNTKLGAEVCEHVLEVTEKILQEASSNRPVLSRSLSQPGLTEEEGESQLKTFLEHISAKFVQSNPSVRDRLLQIIPFLTFGDVDNMNTLLDYFSPHLDFDQFDVHASPETRTYFDCFCVVTSGIGSDPSGDKLKELVIEKGIVNSAITYLKTKVPAKLTLVDSTEWQQCLSLPSIPYVLRMLAGLCKQHTSTQLAAIPAIEKVHLLEQVSTEKHIGTLAENVLEAMMENPDCQAEIKAVRKATREEKKRKAMALRKKELGALGMHVNAKGQVVAQSPLLQELGSLEEETGLKCCICLEGYRSHPQKVLGVYTFSKKVTLDEFESKPRKTMGICTVSHFNVVHYDCHSSAVKLARGRDEWESAVLQNANTKCNGLMPIWGPKISDSSFASSLARHTSYLQESTSIFDPSFLILAHDIRLLLLRFAYEKSFSAESGGGGAQSNLHLIPYLIHIAIYVLNSTRAFQREERNLASFLSATADKWVSSSYELDGPLYAVVASLFLHTLAQWKEHRLLFLRRLLVLAHTRNSSSSPIKTLSSSDPVDYTVYKPVLVLFSLVDGLQHMLKGTVEAEGADLPHALLEYIRNNDVALLEGCDKLLSKYQDELLPAESFEEMCDVMGLLTDIEQPATYLAELLTSASQ